MKPHLSATQLDCFARCPEQYRRRYLEGERIPPGVALIKGTGFHRGAETNMRQKLDSRRDLPETEIVEAAAAAFDEAAAGGLTLSAEEAARGAPAVLGEAKENLVDMARCHARQQAPDYQPILVEQVVRIELPGPRDLLGVIDLADDRDRVVDFKTSGKAKPQSEADASVQLTVYAAAFHAHVGRLPSGLLLDTVVTTKKGSRREALETVREEADFSALAHRINAISSAIDAGSFAPASPGAWWCGAKWCGFYETCCFVNPNRGRAAQGD